MSSINNILIEAIYAEFLQRMITDVEDEDDAKLGLVKSGKLQDDPTIYVKSILIQKSDKHDALYKDGDHNVFTGSTYTIGGTYNGYWWRKFKLSFKLFFSSEPTRDEARQTAMNILSRAQHVIFTIKLPAVKDDYGESPVQAVCYEALMTEGGGPGNFIWRGEMCFDVLTSVEID